MASDPSSSVDLTQLPTDATTIIVQYIPVYGVFFCEKRRNNFWRNHGDRFDHFNAANTKAHILPSFRHDERWRERKKKNLNWAWPRRHRRRRRRLRRRRRPRWRRSIQWNKHKFLMEHQCHRVVLHAVFFFSFGFLCLSLCLHLSSTFTSQYVLTSVDRRQRDCKLNSFAENRKNSSKSIFELAVFVCLSVASQKSQRNAKMQNQFTTASKYIISLLNFCRIKRKKKHQRITNVLRIGHAMQGEHYESIFLLRCQLLVTRAIDETATKCTDRDVFVFFFFIIDSLIIFFAF